MSKDVYTIVKQMNLRSFEIQLALQCAPLIAGLKVSNLFIISVEEMNRFEQALKQSDISWYILAKEQHKVTLLLFRMKNFSRYLTQNKVVESLKQFRYEDMSISEILTEFRLRYQRCIFDGGEFPHEMGILLGYPVEDVRGFIQYEGKKYLHSGYWKVYDRLPEKLRLFQRYDFAMESLIQFLYYGLNIVDILDIYRLEENPHIR